MLFSDVIVFGIKNARRCKRRIRFVSLPPQSGLFTCWHPGCLCLVWACAVHFGTCSKCAFGDTSRRARTLPCGGSLKRRCGRQCRSRIFFTRCPGAKSSETGAGGPVLDARLNLPSCNSRLYRVSCAYRFLSTAYMSVDLHGEACRFSVFMLEAGEETLTCRLGRRSAGYISCCTTTAQQQRLLLVCVLKWHEQTRNTLWFCRTLFCAYGEKTATYDVAPTHTKRNTFFFFSISEIETVIGRDAFWHVRT